MEDSDRTGTKGSYLPALICGIIIMVAGIVIILGWLFHFYSFTSIRPDWPIIKFNTAICYALLGMCLVLLSSAIYTRLRIYSIRILSFLSFLVSGLTIIEIIFNLDIIHQLFLPDYCQSHEYHYNCRSSFLSAFNIAVIAGICFFKSNRSNFKKGEDQYILLIPIFISLFCLLCYLYGSDTVLKTKWTTISFTSPVLLLLLSFPLIFERLDKGWAKVAYSKTASGSLLRTMIIPNAFIFIVIGLLRLSGELRGLYDTSFGLTIMVTSEIIIISTAIIIKGVRIYKLESDYKNMQEKLSYKNNLLFKINNDLDNFIYTTSHDLKAPINNIESLLDVTFGEIEKERRDNETIAGTREMLNESIRKLKTTLDDLAVIGKAQLLGENISLISFKEIVGEVKINLKNLIEKNDPVFMEDYQVTHILFSRKNLRSILQNLISNAIKYHYPGRRPTINISTKAAGDFILLKVSDNGLGISEQEKSKVFEVYTRFHKEIEGTGIGMNIVARIINNNGGKIIIDSEVGKGSTFNIYLKEESAHS